MSIWGLLFSFKGRIPRKTYWLATLTITLIGLASVAGAAFYLTGDALSPVVWRLPPDKVNVWGPVWGAYTAVILWPSLAITIKRWHDRNRPAWAYLLILLIFLAPGGLQAAGYLPSAAEFNSADWMNNPGAQLTPEQMTTLAVASVLGLVILVLGLFVTIELGFLEGTNGPNRFGADPLPSRPAKPWAGFGARMFALKGRIGRSGWWYGLLMTFVTLAAALLLGSAMVYAVLPVGDQAQMEELMNRASDPIWLKDPANMRQYQAIGAAIILFNIMLLIPFWNVIAISVKRLHDRGRSGFWVWLPMLAPILALVASVAIKTLLGDTVPPDMLNRYMLAPWAVYILVILWCFIQYGVLGSNAGANKYGEPRA